jgi:hypothetical protein
MNRLLIVVLFVSNSCSYNPDFTTSHGLDVFGSRFVDAPMVECATEMFIRRVPAFDEFVEDERVTEPRLRRMIDKLHVVFVSEFLVCGDELCGGLYYPEPRRLEVVIRGTFSESSFLHELLHAVEQLVLSEQLDYTHECDRWKDLDKLKLEVLRVEQAIYGLD